MPAQALPEAAMAIGRQAGVSIGLRDTAGCAGVGRPVRGRMSVGRALSTLLTGTGCDYRRIDGQAYVVTAAARAATPVAPLGEEDPARPQLLDSIVVSTARRDALVGRTPYAISVLSGGQIEAAALTGSQGVASQFAGLIETNLGSGRDKLFIRGISDGAFTGRTQSTVGLYLDDVPITYSAPNPDLFLADIERVEVLRGPQGSLYGVGSVGGLMRIVTRRPDAAAFHAGASTGLEFTADGSVGRTVSAMANVPLRRDRVAVRAVAYSEVDGGYLDNAGLGLSNVNRSTRRGLRAAVSGQFSPTWKLAAGVTLQSLNADDGQSALAGSHLDRGRALVEPHDNDFRQASATLDGKGAWGGLKVSAGYVRHDYDSRYDASDAAALFGLGPGPTAYDETNQVEFTVAEAVLRSPEPRRLQWLMGVFTAHAEQETEYAVARLGTNPAYREQRKDALHETALFGEASYALTDQLKVTVGGRGFGAVMRTASTNPLGSGSPTGGRLKKTDISPKAVLAFQASPDALFYIQAAEGYRLGGFNTSGLAGEIRATGQPAAGYGADELWSYEAGAKAALMGGRLQLQTAAFYAVWRNVQSDQFLTSGLPYTANVGRAVNRGVELEASFRADPRLTLTTNLLLNGPEVARVAPTFAGRPDAGLPAVPKVSGSLLLDYRRPLGAGLVLGAHGQIEYVSRSRLSFGPVAGAAMGGYVTNRLALEVSSARWRARVTVENVTDARQDTFAFGNPFSGARAYTTPLQPRRIGASFAADL